MPVISGGILKKIKSKPIKAIKNLEQYRQQTSGSENFDKKINHIRNSVMLPIIEIFFSRASNIHCY